MVDSKVYLKVRSMLESKSESEKMTENNQKIFNKLLSQNVYLNINFLGESYIGIHSGNSEFFNFWLLRGDISV